MATDELTNYYYGPSSPLCVDTTSSDLQLYAGDASCALKWKTSGGPQAGTYNFCTSYDDTDYCLDIVNNEGTCPQDCTTPHLATPGYYTGQQWTLLPEANDYAKLSNGFTGAGWYLDTYSDTKGAFMSHGDFEGQYWDVGFLGLVLSSSSSSSTTASPSTSPTSSALSTSSSTPSSTSQPAITASRPPLASKTSAAKHESSGKGLSTGAIAGIAVGVGVAALAVIFLGVCLLLRRKKRRQRVAVATPPPKATPNMTKNTGWSYQDKNANVSELEQPPNNQAMFFKPDGTPIKLSKPGKRIN